MRPKFGSLKYSQLTHLQKRLKNAKTECDKKRLQSQIILLETEIKKEEEAEEYFDKM
jgi:hypothetical protein